jgi:cephalosporin-C deacetylase-like acetyl esterase
LHLRAKTDKIDLNKVKKGAEMTASEIEALGGYYGATPKPADFEAFWQARMAEADAVPLDYTVT